MSARFLIFGGAGFVGARIARELNMRNIEYRVSRADIRDGNQVRAEIADLRPTHVINAAAKGVDPTARFETADLAAVNVGGAITVQTECGRGGVETFVHLGSCFEYGSYDADIKEDFAAQPTTPYAETKAQATAALLAAAPDLECRTIVLRLFGIWGPGERPHRLVPQIIAAAKSGRPLPLTHGRQIRDFSFVDDMAGDIVNLCFSAGLERAGIVNVGSGKATPVLEFARHVARVLKCQDLLMPGALPERPGEMRRMVADTGKLSTLIQLRPRTSIEVGLALMA